MQPLQNVFFFLTETNTIGFFFWRYDIYKTLFSNNKQNVSYNVVIIKFKNSNDQNTNGNWTREKIDRTKKETHDYAENPTIEETQTCGRVGHEQ